MIHHDQSRGLLRLGLVSILLLLLLFAAVGPAQADKHTDEAQLKNTMTDLTELVTIVIVAVAAPNGAFGLLQWMTAGANQEKNEKGKERIRNTFIALAGAAVINIAVDLMDAMLDISPNMIVF